MRILLVARDGAFVPSLRDALEEAGFHCTHVVDIESTTVRADEVDLVVVGAATWDDAARESCRAVHRFGSRVPLLVVSQMGDLDARLSARAAGADDVVSIPFSNDDVAERARTLVRRGASTHLRFGPLALDTRRRVLTVDEASVSLTVRESDVLSLLMERAGRDVTRAELSEHTRRAAVTSDSNWLEVHISRLRAKLGPRARILETVRGVGYRLRLRRSGSS